MGDHGLRYTDIAGTEIGKMENNNPMLYVILPEKLRKDAALRKIMEENSKQLTVHYDIYATLMDIARVSLS